MNKQTTALIAWFCALSWAAFIYYISSLSKPVPSMPELQKYHADLAFHSVEYGLLAVLWCRAMFVSFPNWSTNKNVLFVFIFCVFYAASDEFHQSFVPNRTMSLADWSADVIGSAVVLWFILKGRFKVHASN